MREALESLIREASCELAKGNREERRQVIQPKESRKENEDPENKKRVA